MARGRGGSAWNTFQRTSAAGRRGASRDYDRQIREARDRERGEQGTQSTWTPRASEPPFTGVVESTGDIVSFKTGGPSGNDTLIADGDYHDDRKGFDANHDHHGPWGSADRGHYTSPDH